MLAPMPKISAEKPKSVFMVRAAYAMLTLSKYAMIDPAKSGSNTCR